MDKNSQVLHLINNICKGRKTYRQVQKELDKIEKKYGELDLLYHIEDRMDFSYVEKLVEDAYIGVYSKESILRIGQVYDSKGQRYVKVRNTIFIVAIIILLIVLMCLL